MIYKIWSIACLAIWLAWTIGDTIAGYRWYEIAIYHAGALLACWLFGNVLLIGVISLCRLVAMPFRKRGSL